MVKIEFIKEIFERNWWGFLVPLKPKPTIVNEQGFSFCETKNTFCNF